MSLTRFAASVASSASRSSPSGVPGSAYVLIGTARQRARAPWKIATAPGYVGFSIITESPGRTNALLIRSKDCWHPSVMSRFSSLALLEMLHHDGSAAKYGNLLITDGSQQ